MAMDSKNNVPCCLSQRWILSYISCWAFIMVYAIRINFSVAIVCMVDPTSNFNSTFYTSLNENYTNSTESNVLINKNQGEFDWPKSVRSSLLAMYYYGYILLQIPGGWVATRFGGKRVLGLMTFITSILTLLTPVCARLHVNALYAIRFMIGFCAGVSFPAMHSMWGRWAPPLERSKLMGLSYSGPTIGVILTYAVSGLLCVYGFDNGWGSIFYVTGIVGILWSVTWYFMIHDTPQEHTRITPAERRYIENSIGSRPQLKVLKTPWVKMFTSSALWACLISHVCNNWTNYTLQTSLPLFMREVLEFDIKQNGFLSAVPYICNIISANTSGHIIDYIRSKGYISTGVARRSVQSISFVGQSVCLVAVGFMGKEQRHIAVVFLSLSMAFTGLNKGGYVINHVDFAPRFAGTLFGITNTFATIPGMVAPIVAGLLTPNRTVEEWRVVFYVCAGIGIFGAIFFAVFGKGEVQDWARDPELEHEIDVMRPLKIPDYNTDEETNIYRKKFKN
ncbi:hypothetical protein SNE40_014680 [Patella caerulea]|uniref:Sialin n=1 Tax=Patella caerulea TaxID=87958 RepID=A0AAN8PDC8_PATCE